jgi:hypothetical protein
VIGASPTTAPSLVTQADTYADDTWNVISWPETDLAADLGWSAGWTIMLFGMLKVLSVGLSAERKARGSYFSRR